MNENRFESDDEMSPDETQAGIKILLNTEEFKIKELYPAEAKILQDYLDGTATIDDALLAFKKVEDCLQTTA